MFDWIPALFEKATIWCPRYQKVPPTYRLVKWVRCGEGTVHGPGCVWFWPLVTEIEDVDVRWHTTVMHSQSFELADGTPVSARCLTLWRVSDPLVAIGENADYSDRVGDITQSCVVDTLGSLDRDATRDKTIVNMMTTIAVREELELIGLEVARCKFTELIPAPAVRIINGD